MTRQPQRNKKLLICRMLKNRPKLTKQMNSLNKIKLERSKRNLRPKPKQSLSLKQRKLKLHRLRKSHQPP